MERVIFRTDHDPYMKCEKYLAIFPDDPTNVGRLAYVSFYFNGERPVFEPYGEMSIEYYYYNTKRIKKGTELSAKCLCAIEWFYDSKFVVREKLRS